MNKASKSRKPPGVDRIMAETLKAGGQKMQGYHFIGEAYYSGRHRLIYRLVHPSLRKMHKVRFSMGKDFILDKLEGLACPCQF